MIAESLEAAHDVVFQILDELVPNRTYFADWIVDEFFMVIYDENGSEERLVETAAAILAEFATRYRQRLEGIKTWEFIPVVDFGAALGWGEVGLLGPKRMRKTTVIGEVGGLARRLETAAKEFRNHNTIVNPNPIIAVGKTLLTQLEKVHPQFAATFANVETAVKDLDQTEVYVYQHQLRDTDSSAA